MTTRRSNEKSAPKGKPMTTEKSVSKEQSAEAEAAVSNRNGEPMPPALSADHTDDSNSPQGRWAPSDTAVVEFFWQLIEPDRFSVQVFLTNGPPLQLLVNTVLSKQRPNVAFSVYQPGGQTIYVGGTLAFSDDPKLMLSVERLVYPSGRTTDHILFGPPAD